MQLKAGRFEVLKQGLNLEPALVVIACILTQLEVCQQKQWLDMLFTVPVYGLSQ